MIKKERIYNYIIVFIGATILSCGIYNIHHYCGITEGGELGLELLVDHWFHISPSFTAVIMDLLFYTLAWYKLGNSFLEYAIVATGSYSLTYRIWEHTPYLFPELNQYPLLSSLLGALFVGIGCGLVVRIGGACSGDDALALVLSKQMHISITYCYLFTDLTILLLSLSYIPFTRIIYSIITVNLSSFIIGRLQKKL